MLRNKALTIEIYADVLENHPSFTAHINIDETDKNIKQEDFNWIINQLSPDNDIIYMDHDKKNNKFRVRMETSDKNITQIFTVKVKTKMKGSKCYLYSWEKKTL